jgi:hypothetical protein
MMSVPVEKVPPPETQPTERDRQLDEAYQYISARITPAVFADLESYEQSYPIQLTLC